MQFFAKNFGKLPLLFALIYLPALASFAATPTLTGRCGATLNFMKKGVPLEDGVGLSGIGILDFDKKTATGSLSSYDSKSSKKSSLQVISWTFEMKQGYLDGSALLISSDPNKPTIHIIPVNDGKSYLLQVIDADSIGVCQKL